MNYKTFSKKTVDVLSTPFFFGSNVNVARYDMQRHTFIENVIEKQISFFWRPDEVNLTGDIKDVHAFTEAEKHFFISNLQYQILLDSVQGRGPNVAFLPIVSSTELETWIINWTFSETIHSRSYSHMLSALPLDPDEVFSNITKDQHIIARSADVTKYYDDLIYKVNLYYANDCKEGFIGDNKISLKDIKKSLYLCLHAVNALEAIRFVVSFICTFIFTEHKKIEGCTKIIQFIARDENLHNIALEYVINAIHKGKDTDAQLTEISNECRKEAEQIFIDVAEQEKQWATYLFSKGKIFNLTEKDLHDYIDFLSFYKMQRVGLQYNKDVYSNPLAWANKYFDLQNMQLAPQETELVNYLSGQVESDISKKDFKKFKL